MEQLNVIMSQHLITNCNFQQTPTQKKKKELSYWLYKYFILYIKIVMQFQFSILHSVLDQLILKEIL